MLQVTLAGRAAATLSISLALASLLLAFELLMALTVLQRHPLVPPLVEVEDAGVAPLRVRTSSFRIML